MPLNVANTITIPNASKEQFDTILKKYMVITTNKYTGLNNLEFNAEVIMPTPYFMINIGVNDRVINSYSYYVHTNPDNLTREQLHELLNSNDADNIKRIWKVYEEALGEAEFNNVKLEFPILPDFFNWCIENWGNKWGSYNTIIDVNAQRISFDTADNPYKSQFIYKFLKELIELIGIDAVADLSYSHEDYFNESGLIPTITYNFPKETLEEIDELYNFAKETDV